MRLLLRDIGIIYNGERVADGASYTFETGHVYGITGSMHEGRKALLEYVSRRSKNGSGTVYLAQNGEFSKPESTDFAVADDCDTWPEYMTAEEYVVSCALIHGTDVSDVKGILKDLKIKNGDRLIKDLDNSDRQKIRLAAIIAAPPRVVMLFDNGSYGEKYIKNFIRNIRKDSIILISSDEQKNIRNICDEVIMLSDGAFVPDGAHGGPYA